MLKRQVNLIYYFKRYNNNNPSTSIVNYFNLLNIDERFDINLNILQQNYKDLMKKYHPDLSHNLDTNEQKNHEIMAIKVNNAKKILESPLWRAQHLLSLKQQNNLINDDIRIMDMEFLANIMDIRLEIENNDDISILKNIYNSNKDIMEDTIKIISNEFDKISTTNNNNEISIYIENINMYLAKLTYYHRIDSEVREKLPAE